MTCISSGCGTYTFVEVKASGGVKPYKYSIDVYKNGKLVDPIKNSTSNKFYYKYSKGTYKINYTVTDSEGTSKSGTTTTTIS